MSSIKCIYTPTPCQVLRYIDWNYEPPSHEELMEGSSLTNLGWPQYGEDNGMYGKTISDEQKKAIGESASKRFKGVPKWYKVTNAVLWGSDNPRAQACIINDIEYETVTAASKALGIHRTTISHRCKSPNIKYKNYSYK